jgi:hypothetical protein
LRIRCVNNPLNERKNQIKFQNRLIRDLHFDCCSQSRCIENMFQLSPPASPSFMVHPQTHTRTVVAQSWNTPGTSSFSQQPHSASTTTGAETTQWIACRCLSWRRFIPRDPPRMRPSMPHGFAAVSRRGISSCGGDPDRGGLRTAPAIIRDDRDFMQMIRRTTHSSRSFLQQRPGDRTGRLFTGPAVDSPGIRRLSEREYFSRTHRGVTIQPCQTWVLLFPAMTADCRFASGCFPPRLAATQLPSAAG